MSECKRCDELQRSLDTARETCEYWKTRAAHEEARAVRAERQLADTEP